MVRSIHGLRQSSPCRQGNSAATPKQNRRPALYPSAQHDRSEINRLIHDQFVPRLRKAKGFQRYYWRDTGEGEGASFGVFQDKDGADQSVTIAAEFVRTHMAKLLRQKPEVIEGPI